MTARVDSAPADSQAEAFKRLYPDQYYRRFLSQNTRPDGRSLTQTRPASVVLGVITSADSSALIKIGNTTVIAGVKLEVLMPKDPPDQGCLQVNVELTTLCSPEMRDNRPTEVPSFLTQQVDAAVRGSSAWQPQALCIQAGRAAWAVYLDLYVLCADGVLLDACVLAAMAALNALRLAPVDVTDAGNVVAAGNDAMTDGTSHPQQPYALSKQGTPLTLTCAVIDDRLIADPSSEEESLAATVVSTTVDGQGHVMGLQHAGGGVELSTAHLQQCITAAQDRHTDLFRVLSSAQPPDH
ncbi:hypothetical protein WJX73_008734 [Symbiochloris irregularis]|uniref:Ribosomal RNA-processing protein 43 n=1 Tax=Symbiochloris irregularis TaxID=706552 RepID=A0AAW1PZX5_9CHLO